MPPVWVGWDRVYKCRRWILDRGPWRAGPPARILDGDLADSDRRKPPARSASADPLMREVRWRLFRREDLPARLRRLERLEQVALARPAAERPPPEHPAGPR